MLTALINGILGIASTYWVGLSVLHLEPTEVTRALVASLIAGFIAPLITLRIERLGLFRAIPLPGGLKTWVFFVSMYFGPLLLGAPVLHSVHVFLPMILPLILSTGLSIIAFGPVQDKIVASMQRHHEPRVGDGSAPGP